MIKRNYEWHIIEYLLWSVEMKYKLSQYLLLYAILRKIIKISKNVLEIFPTWNYKIYIYVKKRYVHPYFLRPQYLRYDQFFNHWLLRGLDNQLSALCGNSFMECACTVLNYFFLSAVIFFQPHLHKMWLFLPRKHVLSYSGWKMLVWCIWCMLLPII